MPPLPRTLSSSYRPSRAGRRTGRPPAHGTAVGPGARTVGAGSAGSGGGGTGLMDGGPDRQTGTVPIMARLGGLNKEWRSFEKPPDGDAEVGVQLWQNQVLI